MHSIRHNPEECVNDWLVSSPPPGCSSPLWKPLLLAVSVVENDTWKFTFSFVLGLERKDVAGGRSGLSCVLHQDRSTSGLSGMLAGQLVRGWSEGLSGKDVCLREKELGPTSKLLGLGEGREILRKKWWFPGFPKQRPPPPTPWSHF